MLCIFTSLNPTLETINLLIVSISLFFSRMTSDSSVGKELACSAGDPGSIPGLGRSPGEGNANYSSIVAWKIPWTEEPNRLQSMGLQELDTT